ncbi:hypothetical protein EV182_000557 [Spiromyces aspiralis]|uniref:Uncharacterized protein n=1 Tax=Spiromyces aspiralis TaxID=68401 RepID=A0ACC1I0D5_9FUNG|nr:hypothetical protein EV182_000557 [Spiromyces aspiralis]
MAKATKVRADLPKDIKVRIVEYLCIYENTATIRSLLKASPSCRNEVLVVYWRSVGLDTLTTKDGRKKPVFDDFSAVRWRYVARLHITADLVTFPGFGFLPFIRLPSLRCLTFPPYLVLVRLKGFRHFLNPYHATINKIIIDQAQLPVTITTYRLVFAGKKESAPLIQWTIRVVVANLANLRYLSLKIKRQYDHMNAVIPKATFTARPDLQRVHRHQQETQPQPPTICTSGPCVIRGYSLQV